MDFDWNPQPEHSCQSRQSACKIYHHFEEVLQEEGDGTVEKERTVKEGKLRRDPGGKGAILKEIEQVSQSAQ